MRNGDCGMNIRSKSGLRWFKSMMLTVGVILLLCTLLLGYVLAALHDTMLQTSSNLTQYLQDSVDARLRELQKYSAVLELDLTNLRLKRMDSPVTEITPDIYIFGDQIQSYQVTNKLVNGIFIYYPKTGLIVGSLGCYPADSYYALNNTLMIEGYEEWLSGIEGSVNELVRLSSAEGESLCYARRMTYEFETVGYIVFQLNTDELLRATETIVRENPSRFAFGILLDGEVCAQTGSTELIQTLVQENELPQSGDVSFLRKRDALLYVQPSRFAGLRYINVYVQSEYLRPLMISLYVCVGGVLACGLFGMAASLYISRRNAKPLHSLMVQLGATPGGTEDEYQVIEQRIGQMMRERNITESKLRDQQDMIGGLFLSVVLSGELHSEYAIFSAAKRYDVTFENTYYLAAVVDLGDPDNDMLRPEIQRWCEASGLDALVSHLGGRYVLLFNVDEELNQQELLPALRRLLSELFPGGRAAAALGQRYDSLVGIAVSYTQALTALPHSGDGRRVVLYNSLMDDADTQDVASILAMEQFSATMQQGKYSVAEESLSPLFQRCFSREDSAELRRVRFAALQNLLLDALRKGRLAGTLGRQDFRSADILHCSSPADLLPAAQRLLQLLQGPGRAVASQSGVAERARDIIHRDYTDPMLGLYKISDELKVSNSHLSTTFKNTFGVGVVQYINQLRIELAKNLIQNTSKSIKDIALSVGYSSDISFIRVFKKYEERTPSALRKIH